MTTIKSFTDQDKVYESLIKLAEDNPSEFEAKRDELISEFIKSLPEKYQKRMACFQWRIDRIRDKTKTPIEACIAISNMMFDSVNKLHKQAREIQMELAGEISEYQRAPKPLAKILEFRTPHHLCD